MSYAGFIEGRSQAGEGAGFDPVFMPDYLFDFQTELTEWVIRQGKAVPEVCREIEMSEQSYYHWGRGKLLSQGLR